MGIGFGQLLDGARKLCGIERMERKGLSAVSELQRSAELTWLQDAERSGERLGEIGMVGEKRLIV